MEISFGTLRIFVAPTVYEPAEDSFLLATYASSCTGNIQEAGAPPVSPTARQLRILEIGCGTGIVSISAALGSVSNNVLGIDMNKEAVECAKMNAEANSAPNCHFMQANMFSSIPEGGKFDVILFNPPYLPTTREEKLKLEAENAAYDGGESGLETFMQFSEQVSEHLAPGGKVAVIATSLNDGIKKTVEELEKRVGSAKIMAEESFFFEKIALVEATYGNRKP